MVTDPKLETLLWSGGTIVFILISSLLTAHLARWGGARLRLSAEEQRKVYWGFLFASPWLIGFIIFVMGPSLASLYYSFTEYKLGGVPEWVGLENYRELIEASGRDGRNFRRAMYNSLYYAIVGVPLQILAALVMALLLNTTVRGVRGFRLIFYMPVILAGGPAILLAWRYMLSSNGGFVNESLSRLADSFFLFDWIYRAFIFFTEGFNGFFIGLTNGDPLGPLKYMLPAIIGTLICISLLRGFWDAGKKQLAQRTAEIITFTVGGLMMASGFVAEPIDISWVFVWGLLVMFGVLINIKDSRYGRGRAWQILGLGLLAFAAFSVVTGEDVTNSNGYLMAIIVSAAAIVATFGLTGLQRNIERKALVLWVPGLMAATLLLILLVHVVPNALGSGKVNLLVDYLTLQSALDITSDTAYLDGGFDAQYLSARWLYGAIVLIMLTALMLGDKRPQARRWLLTGAAIAFALITLSAFVDGLRYFNAYEEVSVASGRPNFHFARFRDAVSVWPDANHNPKWLGSDLWVKPALVLINMWSAGAGMLIFLAALKGVPKSLYEAAEVDGANRLQRFFSITLPIISPAMFYNIVIGMIAALQTFETVYILRTTENETSVMSAAFYLYRRTFEQANIGEGSAISWLLAIIIVALTAMQFRYSNWVNYDA